MNLSRLLGIFLFVTLAGCATNNASRLSSAQRATIGLTFLPLLSNTQSRQRNG